jgi:sugar-specific transcriptional regulator TrmB
MKYSELIKKTYALLEQSEEEQQQAPDATNVKDVEQAAEKIDDVGKKMEDTVKTSMETLVEILKKLVDFLREEERVGNAKYPPKLTELLKKIKSSTMTPDPTNGLSQIEDAIDEAESHYKTKNIAF